ncbi:MAG: DUF1801 domain-containing protein [Chitinispirillaceae bacterium]|nr:DUF1801 domain-containing protein [Chitinispirillaceae bacterium]
MSAKTIDEYIAGFPANVQERLNHIRGIVHDNAPGAEEAMAYGIPTFRLNGNLVHFAGYKEHVGFYPAPSGIKAFDKQLSGYESAKGSVKFPLSEPLPVRLIAEIVKYRVGENILKA